MAKINLTSVLTDDTLNKIKEAIGEEAYGKLATFEFESGEQKLIPKNKFDEQAEQIKEYQSQIANHSKQIEELSAFKGTAEEKEKMIAELNEKNSKMQEEFNAKMLDYKTGVAWEKALDKAGAKNSKALKGMLDSSKITYDEKNDVLLGFDEQVANVRKENSWLFNTQVPQSGGASHTPTPTQSDDNHLRELFGLPKK